MERNQWIISTRNKLADIRMSFDSCAAIEGALLSEKEREDIKRWLKTAIDYIDRRIRKSQSKTK